MYHLPLLYFPSRQPLAAFFGDCQPRAPTHSVYSLPYWPQGLDYTALFLSAMDANCSETHGVERHVVHRYLEDRLCFAGMT